MKLEEAMKHEITRLELEIGAIDASLDKLEKKIKDLTDDRRKKLYDLKALTASFDADYVDKESQALLDKIIKGERIRA